LARDASASNGVATGTLAFDAAASAVKSAIVAVDDGTEAANVTVSGSAGGPYTVTLPAVLTHGTDTGDLVSTVLLPKQHRLQIHTQ